MQGGRGENIRRVRKQARRTQRSTRGGAARGLTKPEEKWLLGQITEKFAKSRSDPPPIAEPVEVKQHHGDDRRVTEAREPEEAESVENGPEPIIVVDRERRALKVRSAQQLADASKELEQLKPVPESFWRFG